MFTSRAEYRLTLRADNADERLTPKGLHVGLVGKPRAQAFRARMGEIDFARELSKSLSLTSAAAMKNGLKVNQDGQRRTAFQLLSMPDVSFEQLAKIWPNLARLSSRAQTALEADALYSAYGERQKVEIEHFRADDQRLIPTTLDYHALPGLSMELRNKLSRVKPATLGQATRVDGMTPAALACVLQAIRRPVSPTAA